MKVTKNHLVTNQKTYRYNVGKTWLDFTLNQTKQSLQGFLPLLQAAVKDLETEIELYKTNESIVKELTKKI